MTPARRSSAIVLRAIAGAALLALGGASPAQQRVEIVANTPVGDTGIPAALFPANIQSFGPARSAASATPNAADMLAREAGSVSLNDTQGNGFQVDLAYRGFTASPILGTPQGLSVFVDGVRINEPFGDVVAWDLVPQLALARVTVVPGTNPVFGLNTLGGALSLRTKTGFDAEGSSVDVRGGSFGRVGMELEGGWHQGSTAAYLAAALNDERGWAVENPSRVRQVFGAIGHHDGPTTLDLSLHAVNSYLAGNQLVPESMLDRAAEGYSRPDHTRTTATTLNLRFGQRLASAATLEGNAYLRHIRREILNTNLNHPVTPGLVDQDTFCAATYGETCAENILTRYTQRIAGLNLQSAVQVPLGAGGRQYLTIGANLEHGRTVLDQGAQDAEVSADRVVTGTAPFVQQSAIGSTARRAALFVTDTLALTPAFSVTASLRLDQADIALDGVSVDGAGASVDVTGSHRYRRANPALGGTWAVGDTTTLFANYAEGLRAPSAIELACADPDHPCAGVPNAFSADPELQAVVAKGLEIGARGRIGDASRWRVAAWRTRLLNDIQFNLSSVSTGYFSNVGETRRSGVELGIDHHAGAWDIGLTLTWQRATFESGFEVANPANADPVVPVRPGDRIPGVPRALGRLNLGWAVRAGTRLEAGVQAQSGQVSRGNENNRAFGHVPGWATLRLGFTQQLTPKVELYGSVANATDRRYANFGMLGNNAFVGASGTNENFWGVGQPRAFTLGVRATL